MLDDCSSNMAPNRKTDKSCVSGMIHSGGIDTKFGYLALLDPKFKMKTRSAAAILDVTLQ